MPASPRPCSAISASPTGFEDFVYLSQVQQGLAIKTAVDYWRSLKPHCMGTLYWQLNDTWPVGSWSSLDHGGGWKLLHYMARRFFAPVAVFAMPGKDGTIEFIARQRHARTGLGHARDRHAARWTARPVGSIEAVLHRRHRQHRC